MEETLIKISNINDFIFCPISIYFHQLLGNLNTIYYHTEKQILGSHIHNSIDKCNYSTSSEVLTSLDVYSEKYKLIGKIDIFNIKKKRLIERKKHISKIFDGQIFQLYAEYYCLKEMGYHVEELVLYSYDDNKNYFIPTPEIDINMKKKFISVLSDMRKFKIENFNQNNVEKCKNCVYEPICDRSNL